jgi:hypothetical protein
MHPATLLSGLIGSALLGWTGPPLVHVSLAAFTSPIEVTHAPLDEAEDPFEVESFKKQLHKIERLGKANEVVFWDDLHASLAATGAPQIALVESVLADFTTDRAQLSLVPNFPSHDPQLYPPGPKRRNVREGTGTWKRVAKELIDNSPPRALPTYYRYDFGAGEIIVLDKDLKKEKRGLLALEFALRGFPIDQDLAEAILLSRLDEKRSFEKEANFFAHDYADLNAKAYDGISLYKVWSHQIPLDVPNVDLRAYAKLIGQTDLPVKISEKVKGAWYPRMSSSLYDYRSHRHAALAAAAHFLQSAPAVPGGWASSANVMHAYYALLGVGADQGSGAMIAAFHDKGAGIATAALDDVKAIGDNAWNAGNARRDELASGRLMIRAAAIAAMERALASKGN